LSASSVKGFRVTQYINKNDNYIFAGAFGLTAFFSGYIYSTTLKYNWNEYDINYVRRQHSVSAISLHCLTPACWCHRAGMSATSASIAAPSSAGSRRSHEASPTPSRGSPPRCVRPCRSAPPPGQRAVCGSATGSASVAGRACRRSPRHKRMPGTDHNTPHTRRLKTCSQHCSLLCTCCLPRPRTSLPLPCTGRTEADRAARRDVSARPT